MPAGFILALSFSMFVTPFPIVRNPTLIVIDIFTYLLNLPGCNQSPDIVGPPPSLQMDLPWAEALPLHRPAASVRSGSWLFDSGRKDANKYF